MKKLFIETFEFSARVSAFLTEENYTKLQTLLMAAPDRGKVIPGCGGMRKVRLPDPRRGKGKRGGIRVIYLHVPEVNRIHLVDIYDKGARDDLNPAEKKHFREVAEKCKREACL